MDSSKYLLEPKGVSQIHSKENPLAQVIRSKLIQDFNLLDHLQGLIINDPKYNMNDIKDPKKLTRLMIEDPLQLSIIPEVINQTHLKISIELYFLKVFRILRVLRSLKRMRKFHQVRLLLLAMTKALKAMTFILMLVLLFAYVFAIVGVSLFRIYTESGNPGREYKFAFVNILHTLQTLFQLFTLDHWHALLIDIWKVDEVDKIASGIYIIFWILIGSFIFRNIIVGIMVSNFQTIRNDLSAQVQQLEDQRKAEQFKLQIMQRRMSQSLTFTKADGAMESEFSAPSEINIKGSSHNSYSSDISFKPTGKDWESYVRINIKLMKFNPTREKVIWPRDSLFRYYELLEQLQYNLEERKTLQFLAAQALMNIHDI
ncbi:cation channel sperm-associated protein 2 isoform X3 [Amblyraja radiata]|uniref:cation channel sperm-associated protein 2 isoform X3 n=1 Tax=Amblyraja radiata TaxID=386614 RepID=UPI001403CD2A|nr:cation channel sperm-associated protein 2 isoform X3 [Amblyraja radiata]